ncbi:hypothetical protein G7Y89_g791 [Cudoniella acicularis]|uniref:GPI anchored protein n=1 Tax=Cudoniella acicularis TaxID=354080 RepID=A0A8H4WAV7_9HELO|nr:hypothetical protein G7Y89_g791 [Cudoniella acicularis]
MYKLTLTALALLSTALAQSTTTLWLIGFDDEESIVASVIASDATATTYSIACVNPADENCGVPSSFTFTQGPSTLHYLHTYTGEDNDDNGDLTIDIDCRITNSQSGTCSATAAGTSGTSTASTVETSTFTDAISLGAQAVILTAGAIGSSANTAASTTRTATSRIAPVTTLTGSSTHTTSGTAASTTSVAQTVSESSRTGSSSTSSVSTGGVPMITGNAGWIVGGAAAVLAIAGM